MTYIPDLGNRLVYCQWCGCKRHLKDVYKVVDKYSWKYGLIICKEHPNETNVQGTPYHTINEKLLEDPTIVSGPTAEIPVVNPNDDRAPGKPTNGFTKLDDLDGTIGLYWSAPSDGGSSNIIGYQILYSINQRLQYNELISKTQNGNPYFKDSINNADDFISYKVAAINGFGQGPYSDEFYWPIDRYAETLIHGEKYIIDIDNSTNKSFLILNNDGSPILTRA